MRVCKPSRCRIYMGGKWWEPDPILVDPGENLRSSQDEHGSVEESRTLFDDQAVNLDHIWEEFPRPGVLEKLCRPPIRSHSSEGSRVRDAPSQPDQFLLLTGPLIFQARGEPEDRLTHFRKSCASVVLLRGATCERHIPPRSAPMNGK